MLHETYSENQLTWFEQFKNISMEILLSSTIFSKKTPVRFEQKIYSKN